MATVVFHFGDASGFDPDTTWFQSPFSQRLRRAAQVLAAFERKLRAIEILAADQLASPSSSIFVRQHICLNCSRQVPKMILVALLAHLFEAYCFIAIRVLEEVIREVPVPRRVRQILLRRLPGSTSSRAH